MDREIFLEVVKAILLIAFEILCIFMAISVCFSLYYDLTDSTPFVLAHYLDFEVPHNSIRYDILRWGFSIFHYKSDLFGILDEPIFIYEILTPLGSLCGILFAIKLIIYFVACILRERD